MVHVYFVFPGPPLNITDGRLSNGTGEYDGRAEIKVGDQWGSICDENFGIADADAFCRLLGLRQEADCLKLPFYMNFGITSMQMFRKIR